MLTYINQVINNPIAIPVGVSLAVAAVIALQRFYKFRRN